MSEAGAEMDLPDHVLERLREAGVSDRDIERLRAQGSLVHEGTNGERIQVELDGAGGLTMNEVSSNIGDVLDQLTPEQADAARAGLHKAEHMLRRDLDGDDVVGSAETEPQPGDGFDWGPSSSAARISAMTASSDAAHVTRSHQHSRSPDVAPHSMRSGNGGVTRVVVLAFVIAGVIYAFQRMF